MDRTLVDEQSVKNRKALKRSRNVESFFDKRLLGRIREYIASHGGKPSRTAVPDMAEYLQKNYTEYSRRKRQAFRNLVQRVCYSLAKQEDESRLEKIENKYLQRQFKRHRSDESGTVTPIEQISDLSDSDSSIVDDAVIVVKDTNMLNRSLVSVYKSGSEPQTPSQSVEINNETLDENSTVRELNQSAYNTGILESDRKISNRSKQKRRKVIKSQEDQAKKSVTGLEPHIMFVTLVRCFNCLLCENFQLYKACLIFIACTSVLLKYSFCVSADIQTTKPSVTFADFGDTENILEELTKLLLHMLHPEVYKHLGITPPRGFLLHGPPGCGKTLLANAIAGELGFPFIRVAATELVSGVSGESEEKIRTLFSHSKSLAPCIVFLDEIDAITPKRETASKDMERRIVAQLLTCMDELDEHSVKTGSHVLVIGATNRPDSIDPALRRAGRFDREISLGIPNEKARQRILKVLCKDLTLSEDFDFEYLARQTPGYVGADLMSLIREAAVVAVNRIFRCLQGEATEETKSDKESRLSNLFKTKADQESGVQKEEKNALSVSQLQDCGPLSEESLCKLFISLADFEVALSVVQPSAKREGFATVPDVAWKDVGALSHIKDELSLSILAPVRHADDFAALGLSSSSGVLLAGPPGCGKTLLAKAIANESGINFISVKGPELLNMYVGESERAVRQVFQRARNSAPCVIFFDEIDSLCPRRSHTGDTNVSARVVNQMLTEMDGLELRKHVFVIAATNRPDIIDPAILRPGRLDKTLYVGIPSPDDRVGILKAITNDGSKPPLETTVDLEMIGRDERCSGFSGADLAALVREAAMGLLKEKMTSEASTAGSPPPSLCLSHKHFEIAFTKVKASVSAKERERYSQMTHKEGLRS
ncbi:nuclear valosin-containing protein-like isoform X1 [Corticium candelabrum]|uniref:nuclear valosin-containing protein-like isoform X1 n=1 Tax=Corticium candelabrum TaxID=121492 RepID=UPI002E258B9F|nr:nuclear valosin-containing protein-like isoform X1 [Corticium candelabrum]